MTVCRLASCTTEGLALKKTLPNEPSPDFRLETSHMREQGSHRIHLVWGQLIQLTNIAVAANPGQFPALTVGVAGDKWQCLG